LLTSELPLFPLLVTVFLSFGALFLFPLLVTVPLSLGVLFLFSEYALVVFVLVPSFLFLVSVVTLGVEFPLVPLFLGVLVSVLVLGVFEVFSRVSRFPLVLLLVVLVSFRVISFLLLG